MNQVLGLTLPVAQKDAPGQFLLGKFIVDLRVSAVK